MRYSFQQRPAPPSRRLLGTTRDAGEPKGHSLRGITGLNLPAAGHGSHTTGTEKNLVLRWLLQEAQIALLHHLSATATQKCNGTELRLAALTKTRHSVWALQSAA